MNLRHIFRFQKDLSNASIRWKVIGKAISLAICLGGTVTATAQLSETVCSGKEFNNLVFGSNNPKGIWSDGNTIWMVNAINRKIYAHHLNSRLRDPSKDFDLDDAGLFGVVFTSENDIWSNGTTMWVSSSTFSPTTSKIYAYNMDDKARNPSEDFNNLNSAGNDRATGIWSDGTTMYVADFTDKKIYAYNMDDKARNGGKDFGLRDIDNIGGIWSDGTTMYVSDFSQDKIFAYTIGTGVRVYAKEFDNLVAAGNENPNGIWSDGTTMWVADSDDSKIYAYSSGDCVTPTFGESVDNQIYTLKTGAITPLVLPIATDPGSSADQIIYILNNRENLPPGLVYTPATGTGTGPGTISGVPSLPQAETTFTYTASDAAGNTAIMSSFTIFVPPILIPASADLTYCSNNDIVTPDTSSLRGIHSNGTTIWVASASSGGKIHAYNLANKSRETANDFNITSGVQGIWSNGTTMWVADQSPPKILAYNMDTKKQDSSKDIGLHNNNLNPTGIWSDGITMWVADPNDKKIYAYNIENSMRNTSKEFDLDGLNDKAYGIWSNSITMWVVDFNDKKIYAYNIENKMRNTSKEFDLFIKDNDEDDNDQPEGIWSNGSTMWVADGIDSRLYAYSECTPPVFDPTSVSNQVYTPNIQIPTLTLPTATDEVSTPYQIIYDLNMEDLPTGLIYTPTMGTVPGTITGTPAPLGETMFTYTATDAAGNTASLTFTITTNNPPTVASEISDQTLEVGGTEDIDISSVFIDPDMHPLTFTVVVDEESVVTAGVTGTMLTLTGVAVGSTMLTLTADDGNGSTVDDTFEVMVVNTPPTVVRAIGAKTLEVSDTEDIDISNVFSDPDMHALTFTTNSGDPSLVTAGVSGPDNDMLTLTGVAVGTATITVTADDNNGGTIDDTFQVTVVNTPPTVTSSIDDQAFQPGFNTAPTIDLNNVFGDTDDLTFTQTNSNPSLVTATLSGTGNKDLTITEGSGVGTANITITATDTGSGTISDTFVVTVNTSPIVVSAIGNQVVASREVKSINLDLVFEDVDNLTFALNNGNPSVVTAVLSGTDNEILTLTGEITVGRATITITATDPSSETGTDTFDVIVNNPPTVVSAISDQTLQIRETIDINLSSVFSDADSDDLTFTTNSDDTSLVTAGVTGSENNMLTLTGVDIGMATISVTADDRNWMIPHTFEITVENTPPTVASSISDRTLEVNDTEDIDISSVFNDPDDHDLTFTTNSDNPSLVNALVSGSDNDMLTITGVAVGTATITLIASDGNGGTIDDTFQVMVTNNPPVVDISISDRNLAVNEVQDIDISNVFSDTDMHPLTFTANSDNVSVTAVVSGSDNDMLTLTGVAVGGAMITVTANDGNGGTVDDTFQVRVVNIDPIVDNTIPPQTLQIGGTENIDISNVFSDLDGHTLTFTTNSAAPSVATAVLSGTMLTLTGVGLGTTRVTVTADDNNGAMVPTIFEVTVENTPPTVVNPIGSKTLEVEGTESIDISNVFSDPDGHDLTFITNSAAPSVATAVLSGTMLIITGKSVGTVMITLTADDSNGDTVDDTFEVTVVNTPPTVDNPIGKQTLQPKFTAAPIDLNNVFGDTDDLNFTVTVNNESVVTAVLSGTNNNMLTLTGVAVGATTITVTATDTGSGTIDDTFAVTVNTSPIVVSAIGNQVVAPLEVKPPINLNDVFEDADDLTFALNNDDPSVVTAVLSGTGNETLTLTGVAVGTATIIITATDTDSETVEDTFVVTVNNSPTVVSAISDQTLQIRETIDINLSSVFSDADSDDLTFTTNSDDTSLVTAGVTGSENNMLTLTGVAVGTTMITVTASDGNGGTVDDTFQVTVNNPPTVVNPIGPKTLEVSDIENIDISNVFSDTDGHELTFTTNSDDTSLVTAGVTGSENDMLTLTGVAVGTTMITVTASDGNGGTVDDTFQVTVNAVTTVNNPPTVASSISDRTLEVGGTEDIDISNVFSDPNSDDLTFTTSSGNDLFVTAVVSGSDNDMLTLTGVDVGTTRITVTANDGNGGTVDDTFQVTVNNPPTVTSPIPDHTLEVDGTEDIDLTGVFDDTDDLTFTVTVDDESVVTVDVDGNVLTITEGSPGTTTVTVTADDGNGGTVSHTFTVTVNAAILEVVPDLKNVISVYPNPSETSFFITLPKSIPAETVEVTMVSLSGKSAEIAIERTANLLKIPISHLPAGHYVLYVHSANVEFSKQVVVH